MPNLKEPRNRLIILLVMFFSIVLVGALERSGNVMSYEENHNPPSRVEQSDTEAVLDNVSVEEETVSPRVLFDPKVNYLEASVSAKAAYVIDIEGEYKYFGLNENYPLPPASTTKIMTALVALENYNLDEVIEFPTHCAIFPTQKLGFTSDERMTIRSLVTATLMHSGADSACALQFKSGDPDGFLKKMNEKAGELGMINTNFTNVIGFDSEYHYASAKDMAVLAKHAMKNETFRKIVALKETVIVSVDGVNKHYVRNTNELLFTRSDVFGIKTGYTNRAGDCLVFAYRVDDKEYIGVILGSENRFEDAENIMRATYDYSSRLGSTAGR